MFTRVVELKTQPGKGEQVSETINEKVLAILKKQKGFVDEMVFVSDKDNRCWESASGRPARTQNNITALTTRRCTSSFGPSLTVNLTSAHLRSTRRPPTKSLRTGLPNLAAAQHRKAARSSAAFPFQNAVDISRPGTPRN